MGLNVRSMIRYAIHTLHYSSNVKDIRDEILMGKEKTIRNNYNAQLEHVGNKDLINVSKKDSIMCQRLWEVLSRKTPIY
jgi:hypothetical protein